MRRLTVVLDSVAALREAAGAATADPGACAALAELAGADAVQLGLTEELRPVSELDVRHVRRTVAGLELRLAPAPSLLKLALEVQPERVVLATDDDGLACPLDFRAWGTALAPSTRTLREAGIAVSALVAPDLEAVKAAHAADAHGVDLYTGAIVDLPALERRGGFERLADVARLAHKLRLEVGLAGGLGFGELAPVAAAVPGAERVCVGRVFAARSILVGVDRAVRDLRARLSFP